MYAEALFRYLESKVIFEKLKISAMRQVLDFILDADVYSQWQVTLNINVFILHNFLFPS